MNISKEDRHNYSKKRRKLVQKGLNPYDAKMLENLDKEWATLRVKITRFDIGYGKLKLMQDLEYEYYRATDMESIMLEIEKLREAVVDDELRQELEYIIGNLNVELCADNLLYLKRLIVRLQAKLDLPIHFYEALDEEYKSVYQKVMNDDFKK